MIPKNLFKPNSAFESIISREDIHIFLDLIPYPSILINSKSRVILSSNGQITELTNFGRQELVGLEIFSLIEQFPNEKVVDGRQYERKIKVKGKSAYPISFEFRYINMNSDIAIIMVANESIKQGNQVFQERQIIESLKNTNRYAFNGNLIGFLEKISTEIPKLFGFTKTYIYLYDDQEKLLKLLINEDDLFPLCMPGIEMDRIKKIDFWTVGKRVLTEVHRVGRKNGFSTIITVPLGNKPIGILAIFSNVDFFETKQKTVFNIYVDWINQYLDHIHILNQENEQRKTLLKNNLYFSKFFEKSTDCFVILNAQNKITFLNEQFQKLLKYSSYELIGQDFLEIIQSEKATKTICHEQTASMIELPLVYIHDRNGDKLPVKMKIIKLNEGDTESRLIILSNIFDEIKSKETIAKIGNQAALGEVIADFAHEVRNPINNISTGLQLMRKKTKTDESSLEIIDRLQSDCVRMNDLMESILSFSRQDTSKFKPFNCYELLVRINNRFTSKYQKYRITPMLICNSENTTIIGDIHSIDQVFTNIINNAVDAMMENGGELTLKLDQNINELNYLDVTISDTGHGIPESLKEKIFDPFLTGKEKGTGLGLAITKRILEAHDGKISVNSFTNGTIFTIMLRLAEEEK